MSPSRHNLTRRALLGAGAGVCAGAAVGLPGGGGAALSWAGEGAGGEAVAPGAAFGDAAAPAADAALRRRWARTLAAYRRAEARVAACLADEARLSPERREWPAVSDLEERFGHLDSLRLAALRRLLRLPAPDLAALSLKLDLALADQAWELTGCETCLETAAEDARRLAAAAPA